MLAQMLDRDFKPLDHGAAKLEADMGADLLSTLFRKGSQVTASMAQTLKDDADEAAKLAKEAKAKLQADADHGVPPPVPVKPIPVPKPETFHSASPIAEPIPFIPPPMPGVSLASVLGDAIPEGGGVFRAPGEMVTPGAPLFVPTVNRTITEFVLPERDCHEMERARSILIFGVIVIGLYALAYFTGGSKKAPAFNPS